VACCLQSCCRAPGDLLLEAILLALPPSSRPTPPRLLRVDLGREILLHLPLAVPSPPLHSPHRRVNREDPSSSDHVGVLGPQWESYFVTLAGHPCCHLGPFPPLFDRQETCPCCLLAELPRKAASGSMGSREVLVQPCCDLAGPLGWESISLFLTVSATCTPMLDS
jgi:hypothetical protein